MRAELRRKVREERRLQNLSEKQITEAVTIQEIAMRFQPLDLKQKELISVN